MGKIKITRFMSLALLLFVSSSVNAEYRHFTVASWMYLCEKYPHKDSSLNAACESYTRGVVEGFYWGYKAAQSIESGKTQQKNPYCFENGHTIKQYIMVIKKVAQEFPEYLHKPAPLLIEPAMESAFKCKEK